MAALVMHINREVIAYGAEICLLRDLHRAQRKAGTRWWWRRGGVTPGRCRGYPAGATVPPSLVAEAARRRF